MVAGFEAYFAFPGDIDVEILDRVARIPMLKGRGEEVFELGVRLGEEAPDVLPLRLVMDGKQLGRLAEWHVDLPTDGTVTMLEAPRIVARAHPSRAPAGDVLPLPLTVSDDGALDHVVVFADEEKLVWREGKRGRMEFRVDVPVYAGLNPVRVVAVDDQGLSSQQMFYVYGMPGASADADALP